MTSGTTNGLHSCVGTEMVFVFLTKFGSVDQIREHEISGDMQKLLGGGDKYMES